MFYRVIQCLGDVLRNQWYSLCVYLVVIAYCHVINHISSFNRFFFLEVVDIIQALGPFIFIQTYTSTKKHDYRHEFMHLSSEMTLKGSQL